jgi:HNH endonuclease
MATAPQFVPQGATHVRADLAVIEERSIPEPNSGCWIWLFQVDRDGYARARVNGKAHQHVARVSYECVNGPLPPGLVPDHLCRVRPCVNPSHVEPVTPLENLIRGRAPAVTRARHAAQTHCKHGHEYTLENTYWQPKKGKADQRVCRECNRAKARLRRM